MDGEVCKEQGKDACGIKHGKADGAVCAAATDCKGVDSCCNTFSKTSGAKADSAKLVCFPAGNAITTSFDIPVVDGITADNLKAGKGFPTVACPKAKGKEDKVQELLLK